MYPELAVRELLANTLIHQDLSATGQGPMVEIFANRIEFTNPGKPLIDPLRFLDAPPRSRNELFAAFMRRLGMCEEVGSGIDKVVFQVELYQLPAPDFRVQSGHTRVTLFGHRKLSLMAAEDKVRRHTPSNPANTKSTATPPQVAGATTPPTVPSPSSPTLSSPGSSVPTASVAQVIPTATATSPAPQPSAMASVTPVPSPTETPQNLAMVRRLTSISQAPNWPTMTPARAIAAPANCPAAIRKQVLIACVP